jgi:tRNA 2-thiouridine synthesizing protein B
MLHIVKDTAKLALAQRYCLAEDSIILVEEAVYMSNPSAGSFLLLNDLNRVYVLLEDLCARGVQDLCSVQITKVDFSGLVELTANHEKSITW